MKWKKETKDLDVMIEFVWLDNMTFRKDERPNEVLFEYEKARTIGLMVRRPKKISYMDHQPQNYSNWATNRENRCGKTEKERELERYQMTPMICDESDGMKSGDSLKGYLTNQHLKAARPISIWICIIYRRIYSPHPVGPTTDHLPSVINEESSKAHKKSYLIKLQVPYPNIAFDNIDQSHTLDLIRKNYHYLIRLLSIDNPNLMTNILYSIII
jgi:hypothetical protein